MPSHGRRSSMAVRGVALLGVGAIVILAGCASVEPAPEPEPVVEPRSRLDWALALAYLEDFPAAHDELAWIYTAPWRDPETYQALLAAAAIELDPRNPERRPSAAAILAARYLRLPFTPPWTDPIAEALYALALEQGAEPISTPDDFARWPGPHRLPPSALRPWLRVEPDRSSVPRDALIREYLALRGDLPLPELRTRPEPTISDQTLLLLGLEAERNELQRRLRQAEDSVAALERELARIRRTLGPP